MAKGSLVTHHQTQHDVGKGGLVSEGGKSDGGDGGNKPRTYILAFPAREGPRPYQVEGCSGWASTRTATRVHFWHRHVRYTVVILEVGTPPPTHGAPCVTCWCCGRPWMGSTDAQHSTIGARSGREYY